MCRSPRSRHCSSPLLKTHHDPSILQVARSSKKTRKSLLAISLWRPGYLLFREGPLALRPYLAAGSPLSRTLVSIQEESSLAIGLMAAGCGAEGLREACNEATPPARRLSMQSWGRAYRRSVPSPRPAPGHRGKGKRAEWLCLVIWPNQGCVREELSSNRAVIFEHPRHVDARPAVLDKAPRTAGRERVLGRVRRPRQMAPTQGVPFGRPYVVCSVRGRSCMLRNLEKRASTR